MQLAGEEHFPQPLPLVFERLTNLDFMAGCVPDLERVVESSAERLVCRVRPGFSFLRGSLDVTMQILSKQSPTTARMAMEAKGIGSSMRVETAVELSEVDGSQAAGSPGGGTQLRWNAEVQEFGGLLKAVSRGLIEAAARKVIADTWAGLRKRLEAQ